MSAVEDSGSPDWEVRRDAARALGLLLPANEPLFRLVALLDDGNIAVEQEAAEALARHGGQDGLRSIFEVLGRRRDDPDADYIAYRLRELQVFERVPIMKRAREIANNPAGDLTLDGIRQLGELLYELGSRTDDPDADYIGYRLYALEASGEYPVLRTASTIDPTEMTIESRTGLDEVRKLLGKQ